MVGADVEEGIAQCSDALDASQAHAGWIENRIGREHFSQFIDQIVIEQVAVAREGLLDGETIFQTERE